MRRRGEGVLSYALLTLTMVSAMVAVAKWAEPRLQAHFARVHAAVAQPYP